MNSMHLKMTSRLFGGALVVLLAGCGAPREGAGIAARGPIQGTVIQYQDWMMHLGARDWRRELDAMRQVGIDLVIIQWLQHGNTSFIPRHAWSRDPTGSILAYADEHGMRVFIGLAEADLWVMKLRDPRYLGRSAAESFRVADEAWRRYGRHPSFAGWYLPQELRDANYGPDQISELRDFLGRLGDYCRSLSGGKPVATAPALLGIIAPDQFGRAYTTLLAGSRIDIVILQDGVGARDWGEDVECWTVPYFHAMHDACLVAGAELWSDLEIFRKGESSSGRIPATIARIRTQLAAESPFVKTFVMFDFFHYMSPARGDAQKRLYDDYVRELVTPGGAPRPPAAAELPRGAAADPR